MAETARHSRRVRRLAAGLTTGALALALGLPAGAAWAELTVTQLDNENAVTVDVRTTQASGNEASQETEQAARNTNESEQNGDLDQSQRNEVEGEIDAPALNAAEVEDIRSSAQN